MTLMKESGRPVVRTDGGSSAATVWRDAKAAKAAAASRRNAIDGDRANSVRNLFIMPVPVFHAIAFHFANETN